jgi:hypothetical protein
MSITAQPTCNQQKTPTLRKTPYGDNGCNVLVICNAKNSHIPLYIPIYIHPSSTVPIYLNMVTNREKTAGILMAVGQDFVTRHVTKRYKALQNRQKRLESTVTPRYTP